MTELFGFIEGTIVAFLALCFLVKVYSDFSFEVALAYDVFGESKSNKNYFDKFR